MPKVTVRYYRLKNKLKEKTLGLAPRGDDEISFDEDILAQATAALEDMAEDYPDWVSTLIDQLADVHRRCVDTPEQRVPLFEQLHSIAHDMRGQGGLYAFTDKSTSTSDNHVEVIKAHIDAMRVVIKQRISGDGGEVGAEIKAGLEAAIKKYMAQNA